MTIWNETTVGDRHIDIGKEKIDSASGFAYDASFSLRTENEVGHFKDEFKAIGDNKAQAESALIVGAQAYDALADAGYGANTDIALVNVEGDKAEIYLTVGTDGEEKIELTLKEGWRQELSERMTEILSQD